MSADKILEGISKGISGLSSSIFPSKKIDEILKGPKTPSVELNYGTGLYLRHHSGDFSGITPYIDFFEPQSPNVSFLGKIKNLSLAPADRLFYDGCRNLVFGRKQKAVDFFHKAVEKDPQLADAYFMLGVFERGADKNHSPRENLSKALLLHNNLGKTLKNALPTFRLIIPVTRHMSFALYADLLGVNLMLAIASRTSVSDEPIKIMQQILDLVPGQSTLLFFYSLFLYERGRREKIISSLRGILPDSSAFELNYLVLAKVLSETGDYNVAIELLKRVLSTETLDPQLSHDYNKLLSFCETVAKGQAAAPCELDLFTRLGIMSPDPASVSSKLGSSLRTRRKTNPSADGGSDSMRPPSKNTRIYLYCKENSTRYPLSDGIVIGSGVDSAVNLNWDDSVAAQHAVITMEGGIFYIENLSSEHGTFVNKFKITRKVPINRGDVIGIGSTSFLLR